MRCDIHRASEERPAVTKGNFSFKERFEMSSKVKVAGVSPDYRDILRILAKQGFEPGLAVERQVAAHVRTLVQEGKLEVNVRIPPIRILAEAWNTNYFTVQAGLRRLVGEGLLVQSPKLGTFVAPLKRSFRRACLYHDHDLSFDAQDEFFSRLNIWLYRMLSERGIQTTSFFDHRDRDKINTMPPELREMVRNRQIDAVIASQIDYENMDWLKTLDIPYAAPRLDPKHGGVYFDDSLLARQAVEEAAKAGKKRIGLLYRHPHREKSAQRNLTDLRVEVEKAAKEHGLEVMVPQGIEEAEMLPVLEQAGFHLCEELLRGPRKPDALFVYPDTYTRGVVSALLKNGVSVPDELLLISHRNADTQLFTPFPVIWLVVQIEDFAKALLKQIDYQIAGKKPQAIIVTSQLETEASKKPTRRPTRKSATLKA